MFGNYEYPGTGLGLVTNLARIRRMNRRTKIRAQRPRASRLIGDDVAWPVEAVGGRLDLSSKTNIVFPDKAANYWMTPIWVDADTEIVVDGETPAARYWSFQTYTADDRFASVVGGVRDAELDLDDGRYRLLAVPAGDDHDPNTIRALPVGAESGVAWLTFRTYKPEDPGSPSGGVPLPDITVRRRGEAKRLEFADTANPAGGDGVDCESYTLGALPKIARRKELTWTKPPGAKTPFPNRDAAYLAVTVARRSGEVVVVRGLAPSFPSDSVPAEDADVQYWSMSKFGLPSTKTIACASDSDVPLDSHGRYTFVVSDPRDRPENATLDNDVVWLPWGPEVFGAIALRNIAPSDGYYPKSVQAIGAEDDPADVMAEYLPEVTQRAKEIFQDGGADACFARE